MKKEEYVIEGMSCASCVNTIENNVSKLKGIKDIKINFVRNIAFVEFDEKIINRVQILSTIKKTGYSAKVVEKYNEKNGKITLLVTGMMSNHCANIVKTS
ncbi:MAG TPA: cation transporter, partial [Bacteroidia bacterium]|nr:cation transporter [Bacteroidia bacterium]